MENCCWRKGPEMRTHASISALSSMAAGNNEQSYWGQGHPLDDLPSGAGLCFSLDGDLCLFYSLLLWNQILVPLVWSRSWPLNPATHSCSLWGSFQGICTSKQLTGNTLPASAEVI